MNAWSSSRLADAMAAAAETINARHDPDERLKAIVAAATQTVPGFELSSVSVAYRGGPLETRAASSALVEQLDARQYEVEEGPCFEAFRTPGVQMVPSIAEERRWPRYIERARQAGVTSQMAVHLGNGGDVRGALNFYSTQTTGIDPEAPGIAALFATQAAYALGWARTEEQLFDALTTRKVIGQAVGIVMERYQIDENRAFAFLTRVSQNSNIKLRDVAREVVAQSDARYTFKDPR